MKAIILAAGVGSRLRPVTFTTPKPLVPVANRPLITYAIDMMKGGGMDEVGIVVSGMDSPLVGRLGDGSDLGVKITWLIQEEQLGLAHAVNTGREFVGDEPFAMFLGDNLFQDKMQDWITSFEASDWDAALALGEVPDPTRFGIAKIENGVVTELVEKPANPPSKWAIAGVYMFRPSIFEAIDKIEPSARGEYEITDAIQELTNDGGKVQPYMLNGWWIDAGKPIPIIQANQLVMGEMPFTMPPENHPGIDEASTVSTQVKLGENVKITNSVVRGPAVIGDNVEITNSFVGPFTALNNDVKVENSEIENSIVMKNTVIRDVPGRIEDSLIGEDATLEGAAGHSTTRVVLADKSYVRL